MYRNCSVLFACAFLGNSLTLAIHLRKVGLRTEKLSAAVDHGANIPKMEHEEAKDRVAELRRQAFVHTNSDRRGSMAYEVGREGKFVAKGGNQGKAIAVFTSGGDAQGLTASIY